MVASQQRLGALLVEMGFIDDAQLASALDEQQRTDKRLGKILVENAILSEDRLVHALSRQLGIEACDPIMTRVHERVLALIPPAIAFRHRVLPVARQREADRRDVVYVATADPLDQDALRAVSSTLGSDARVQWMLAGETEMELALARHYGQTSGPLPEGTKVITGVPVAGPPRSPELDEGVPSRLATTDDVFLALHDQPPPSAAIPASDRTMGAMGAMLASAEPAGGPRSGALSSSDASTEEILLADDVVSADESTLAMSLLNPNGEEGLGDFSGDTLIGPPLMGVSSDDLRSHGALGSADLSLEPVALQQGALNPVAHAPIAGGSLELEVIETIEDDVLEATNVVVDDLDASEGASPAPTAPPTADITDELMRAGEPEVESLDLGGDNGASSTGPSLSEASWGDLLGGHEPPVGLRSEDIDVDVVEPPLPGAELEALTALSRAAEVLPVVDVGFAAPRADAVEGAPPEGVEIDIMAEEDEHPAAPFPPLEGPPAIEEPDDAHKPDLEAIVARLTGPERPAVQLPLPVPIDEAALALRQELQYFVDGGVLDLSSQQRVLRAVTAVLMQEGLLETDRLRAAIKDTETAAPPSSPED